MLFKSCNAVISSCYMNLRRISVNKTPLKFESIAKKYGNFKSVSGTLYIISTAAIRDLCLI